MPELDPRIATITHRIIERSKPGRRRYLALMAGQAEHGISRARLSCGNFAHGFAAAGEDKVDIRGCAGQTRASSRRMTTCYRHTSRTSVTRPR